MLRAVKKQDGAVAENRTEQGVGFARVEALDWSLEYRFNEVGVEDHDEPVIEERRHRDGAAVPPPHRLEKRHAAKNEARRLQHPWQTWGRRKWPASSAAVAIDATSANASVVTTEV